MPLIYVSDADLQRLQLLVSSEITEHQSRAQHSKFVGRYWRDKIVHESMRQQCDWCAVDRFKEAKEYTRKQNVWSALQKSLKHHERTVDRYISDEICKL